jgi:ribose transport system ATP-binding protein
MEGAHMAEASGDAAVSVVNLRKAFGATVAVDDVSFAIPKGSVHALLGENGAGKSTIVNLLSGLIVPDAGSIEIFGQPERLRSPRAAHALGIQTAFQEMTLVRDLTVLDNMLLPYAPIGLVGLIRRRAAAAALRAHFASLGFDVDLDAEIGSLDLAVQQKIEIARAVFRKPRLILLDEPTSTLAGRDVDWLGDQIVRLKNAGVTVVFISHRMREVRRFCDRLTILRSGRHITTGAVADFSEEQVIEMIIGRSIAQTFPPRPTARPTDRAEVFAVRNLAAGQRLEDASFALHRGEILGVAGLQGMGQLDLFLSCFGMAEIRGGGILLDGRPVMIGAPTAALRPNVGIGLLPEDRKSEALFLNLSGKHNVSLPVIGRFTKGSLINKTREATEVSRVFGRVEVERRALWTPVSAFSGGNQQKIAVAKWLLAESRILLLFDPTRGIDVGTKHELYLLMRSYAAAGGSILFHSTEIPELVHLCDRVIVLYGGRVVDDIVAKDLTERAIMWPALGGKTRREEAVA